MCCLWNVSFTPIRTRNSISDPDFMTFNARIDHAADAKIRFQGDHVGETSFLYPRRDTTANKFLRLFDALVWTPREITRNFPVLCPALEDRVRILQTQWTHQQPFRFDVFRHSHPRHYACPIETNERTAS